MIIEEDLLAGEIHRRNMEREGGTCKPGKVTKLKCLFKIHVDKNLGFFNLDVFPCQSLQKMIQINPLTVPAEKVGTVMREV